jgi:hypothetical protein
MANSFYFEQVPHLAYGRDGQAVRFTACSLPSFLRAARFQNEHNELTTLQC